MSTIETLIGEVTRATGLGGNAKPFVAALAKYIFSPQVGGIPGLLNKFQNAGLGDIAKSWIGVSPNMRAIDPGQVRSVLGNQVVDDIGQKAGVRQSLVGGAMATVLPLLFRTFTAGGAMPTTLPANFAGLISGAKPHRKHGGFRLWRWLLPLLALLALAYCGWQSRHLAKAPPTVTPTSNLAAATVPALSFENDGGKVRLGGVVSSIAEKSSVIGAAAGAVGQKNVTANIAVNPNVPAAPWLDKLKALFSKEEFKTPGLKFGFDGNKLKLDTNALEPDKRAAISQVMAESFSDVKIDGLWDRGIDALGKLTPGFGATELADALNMTRIYFNHGSAELSTSGQSVVDNAAKAIQGAPSGIRLEVGGHTDSTGDAEANKQLSEQRAEAVVKALEAAGVPAGRLEAKGYGASAAVGDNSTEEGRAKNRRIEFKAF